MSNHVKCFWSKRRIVAERHARGPRTGKKGKKRVGMGGTEPRREKLFKTLGRKNP